MGLEIFRKILTKFLNISKRNISVVHLQLEQLSYTCTDLEEYWQLFHDVREIAGHSVHFGRHSGRVQGPEDRGLHGRQDRRHPDTARSYRPHQRV